MPLYSYEASDADGAVVRGEFPAENTAVVIEHLQRKNLIPTKIAEKGAFEEKKGSISFFEKVKPLDRILIVRNLGASVRAGLSLIESLDVLIADTKKRVLRKILITAKSNLENGQPLSVTFSMWRQFFTPVFVGMLKAGEASGQLDQTLDELSKHLGREYALTRKIRSALAYPLLLLVFSVLVVFLLLVFVLPQLVKAFKKSGAALPFITQLLVSISNALTFSITLDVVVAALILWFFFYFRKTQTGRDFFNWILFTTPVVKELVKKVSLIRFSRTLGSLIGSGTNIIESLELSADATGNDWYRKAILKSADQIKNGIPFSKTLEEYPNLFPRFLTSLILVGERTGTLEKILKTFADFYDEEMDASLKDVTNLVEPVLLLGLGLTIGAIALAILLPIYQLVSTFA